MRSTVGRIVDVAQQIGVRERVDRGRGDGQLLGGRLDQLDPLGEACRVDPVAGAGEHVGALVDADDAARVAAGERDRDGAGAGGDVCDERPVAVGRRGDRLDHEVVPAPVLAEREQLRPAVVVGGDAREQVAGVALAFRDRGHAGSIAQACPRRPWPWRCWATAWSIPTGRGCGSTMRRCCAAGPCSRRCGCTRAGRSGCRRTSSGSTRSAHVLGLDAPDAAALTGLVGESLDAARARWTRCCGWCGRRGRMRRRPVGFALVTALPDGLERTRAAGIELRSLQLAIGATARRASPWLLPGVKSTSYAVNIAAQTEARRRGADDALFLSLEGIVLEGPTSNVWFVEDGVLHTPALDLGILAGVTRDTLVDVAAEAGIAVESGAYELDRLARATEVFMSSSIREVMPVVRLDGAAVADGRPGPVAAAMQAGLRAAALPAT